MTIFELEKLASMLEADWHVRAAALRPNSTDAEQAVVAEIRTAAEALRAAAASAHDVMYEQEQKRLATREEAAEVRCPGCGDSFRGERGLRAHQTSRFVTLACKPRLTEGDE